jgi:hypothetical protein
MIGDTSLRVKKNRAPSDTSISSTSGSTICTPEKRHGLELSLWTVSTWGAGYIDRTSEGAESMERILGFAGKCPSR